jgi:hypothetical protein
MSYAALCELVAARGWVIALAAQTKGSEAGLDEPACLCAIAIYESRMSWRSLRDPIVAVRLDEPPLTLDEAAEALSIALHAGGVT